MFLMKMIKYIGVLLCTMLAFQAIGANDTLQRIPRANGKLIQVDELNNLYIVDKKNGITKYNDTGDSVAFFQIMNNGPIESIDVTDPLRILVHYPNFNKMLVLDRMLAMQNTIDLKLLQVNQATAVATTKDGGFWVYDYSQNKLLKYDRQYRVASESNDLRVSLNVVPRFNYLLERSNELWALSEQNELFVFTRFGDYVNQYKLETTEPIVALQRVGDQLIYATNNKIYLHQLLNQQIRMIDLGVGKGEILGVVFTSEKIYLLKKHEVLILKVT